MLARLQQVRAARPSFQAKAATPRKRKGKPRGLLTQFGDVVKGLPSGLGHIATSLGKEIVSDVPILRHHVHFGNDELLTNQLGQSAVRTAGDVRHPERFAQAVREGTIVDKALEDIGNLSIVGGAAGKALTAAGAATESAGLARAGALTTRASALGGEVANAPISVPRAGLTVLTERGLPLAGRFRLGPVDEALGRRMTLGEMAPTTFKAHGREAMKLTKQESRLAERDKYAMLRSGFKESTGREKLGGNPTAAEEAAATAITSGQADIGRLAAERGAAPETIQRVLSPQQVPESHLTPEGAQVAQEFLADPASHPRVARLIETRGRVQEGITREALDPETGRQSMLEPEQVTSHEPLSRKVDEFHAGWDKQIADAQQLGGHGLVDELMQEKEHAWQQFLDNPDNYPARWRKRMVEAQQMSASGVDVPTRPPDLAAAGVLPEYLPAGRSGLTRPKASRMEMTAANEGATGDIKLSSEKLLSSDSPYGLYSNRTLYDRWANDARQSRLNKLYRTLTDTEGQFATSPAKLLGEDTVRQLNDDAMAEAQRRHPDGIGVPQEQKMLAGDAIRQAMREKGMEVWAATGDATGDVPASQIHAESPFLDVGMKRHLSKQWTDKKLPLGLKAMEAINRKFKGAVLPWSIRWQLGDLISNYMLSAVAGTVDPITLTKRMVQLRKLTPEEMSLLDARVQDAGLTFPEQEWQHNLPSRENARFREHPIKALQRPGYRLNSTINRVQRHGFYLEKLDRMLGEQGISLADAGRQVESGIVSPEVNRAIDKAVAEANEVLGAFDELSPFERRWMRNVFPFYPWMRHITTLSAKLAIDNPIRVMWVMRIGSEGADPNSQLPGYMRGAIHTPLGSFDSNFLNPFADATGQSPLTPEGFFRAMSPAIKVGAAAATGADLNRGGLQLSRPFNTGRTDDFGRQSFNPLFLPGRWDELAYLISQQTPQSRLAVNLAPQVKVGDVTLGPVSRYGSGALVKRGKSEEPLGTDPRAAELARLVSIPVPMADDKVRGIVRSIQRRKKTG